MAARDGFATRCGRLRLSPGSSIPDENGAQVAARRSLTVPLLKTLFGVLRSPHSISVRVRRLDLEVVCNDAWYFVEHAPSPPKSEASVEGQAHEVYL